MKPGLLIHRAGRVLALGLTLGLALLLGWAMLDLPSAAVRLPEQVAARLAETGVSHPVTAVLLDFRSYDTLLEVGVLLLAVIGVLATRAEVRDDVEPAPEPMLLALARVTVPLMVVVAGYLLWAGAHRPGGAFQAGAVLAAAGVLLRLAGRLPAWATPGLTMRLGLTAGLLIFLLVAAGVMVGDVPLLDYPPDLAGGLILLIEAGLAVSIGLTLAGLFLSAPTPGAHREDPS
jgi:multisubunit Na+/H+ antiporter MnhB subunit